MNESNRFQPRLVGSTADIYQGPSADTAQREAVRLEYEGKVPAPEITKGSNTTQLRCDSNYFKSAQWYILSSIAIDDC